MTYMSKLQDLFLFFGHLLSVLFAQSSHWLLLSLNLSALTVPSSFPLHFAFFLPSLWGGAVRITHSHTSESMSFKYQRTHQSVCIDTRPNLRAAHTLFESDSEDEEECGGGSRLNHGHLPLALTHDQSLEPQHAGDPAWWLRCNSGTYALRPLSHSLLLALLRLCVCVYVCMCVCMSVCVHARKWVNLWACKCLLFLCVNPHTSNVVWHC